METTPVATRSSVVTQLGGSSIKSGVKSGVLADPANAGRRIAAITVGRRIQ
jgi:hypothetical protein